MERMPLNRTSIARVLLLLIAGALCLLYSALGMVGVWIFGGRLHSAADVYSIFSPLLVFPLFLISFISLRWSVVLLWIYVIADSVWKARGNWRALLPPAIVTN